MTATAEGRTTFERALSRRAQQSVADENARAEELLQGGGRVARAAKHRRPALGKVLLALAAAGVVKLVFFTAPSARGTRPLNAVALASADGTGLGSSPVGFLTEPSPVSPPSGTPSPEPSASPDQARAAAPARPRPVRGERGAPLPTARMPRAEPELPVLLAAGGLEGQAEYSAEVGLDQPAPAAGAALPPPAVVNMGTRLAARLEGGLRTGATLTPVTAVLTAELRLGDRVILPVGGRLVGSAFATNGDDRVQLVWRAVVVNGRTVPFEGETLADDGTLGLVGKVIDRRGKGLLRRIGSVALTAAGATIAYGVPGGDGVLGRAGDVAADQAGRQLERMGQQREWIQADKVVELRAGTSCVVYVASDVVLPPGADR